MIELKCGCVLKSDNGITKIDFCDEGFRLSLAVDKAVFAPSRSTSDVYEKARDAYLAHVLWGPIEKADHPV